MRPSAAARSWCSTRCSERGLERFLSPQHPVEMLTRRATKIARDYYQVRVGGDAAVLKG